MNDATTRGGWRRVLAALLALAALWARGGEAVVRVRAPICAALLAPAPTRVCADVLPACRSMLGFDGMLPVAACCAHSRPARTRLELVGMFFRFGLSLLTVRLWGGCARSRVWQRRTALS